MRRSTKIAIAAVAIAGLITLGGCTTDPNVAPPDESGAPAPEAGTNEWFDQALLLAREVMACGPAQQVLSDTNLQRASSFRQDTATDDEWCRVQPEQISHGHVHDHDHDHAHAHGDRP